MVVSLRHSAVLPYFLTYTGGGAVSDFNGNGLPEITLIRFSVPGGVLQPLSILEIDRDLTVTDITSSVIRGDAILQTDFGRRVMVRDINADGWDDLIIADHGLDADPSPGALNPVFLSDGQGGLVDHSAAFSKRIGFTHSLGIGDLDGDGQADIFFGDIGNDVAYLVSWIEGTGPVIDHLPAPTGMGYFSSALMADLNGNGRSELILGSNTPGRNTIHSWTGEGYDRVELPDPSAAANFHVTDIQSADINGDGRADLVLGYTREQPYYAGYFLQVLIQRPDGSFVDETAARFGPDAFNPTGNAGQGWPKELTLSDLDGDGRVDILLEPRWPGQERLFLQRPDGRFVWQDFGVAFGDSLMVADLDGDGVTEIVSLGNSGPWGATQLRVYDVAQVARSFTPVSPREKTGTAANDRLTADAAGRILFGRAGNDTLQGSALADRLHGETGDDSLAGDDGNDTLYGGLGNDRLFGGAGEDELWLGPGANHAEGGAGADRIFGGSGADTAHGDAGEDEILGGVSDDHLFGGADPDRIMGGDGNDALWGADGDDSLSGGNGDDSLSGGEGHDILHAGDGADSLRGDDGNDTLQGEAGDDLLIGGGGDDLLSGHAGHDGLTVAQAATGWKAVRATTACPVARATTCCRARRAMMSSPAGPEATGCLAMRATTGCPAMAATTSSPVAPGATPSSGAAARIAFSARPAATSWRAGAAATGLWATRAMIACREMPATTSSTAVQAATACWARPAGIA